jgi:hypothetical protein
MNCYTTYYGADDAAQFGVGVKRRSCYCCLSTLSTKKPLKKNAMGSKEWRTLFSIFPFIFLTRLYLHSYFHFKHVMEGTVSFFVLLHFLRTTAKNKDL